MHGRADALIGATVFEIKSDLRRELPDAEQQLHRYIAQRETSAGRRFLGIATDGATFIAYELRNGVLTEITRHLTGATGVLGWLAPVIVSAGCPNA